MEVILKRLNKRNISKENKQIIKEFLEFKKASGMSIRRLERYEQVLSYLAKVVNKKLTNVKDEDLMKFNKWLEKQNLSFNTEITFKKILKAYFRYLYKGDLPNKFSEVLKTKNWEITLTPDSIFSKEEIEKIISQTQSIRRKAMIMSCYEGALRVGELFSLKVKDIEFTSWGCRLFVRKSKTKKRVVPLFFSAPLLAQYLKIHQKREDKNSPLWINDKGVEMKPQAFRKMLKKLCEKAKINKRIYPHLLRHSRLTFLSKILKPAELKKFAGWSKIKMIDTYEHLNSTDVEEKLLETYGIKEDIKEKVKPHIACFRCGQLNEVNAKYCYACGLYLSEEVIKDLEKEEKYLNILIKLLQRKEVREIVKEELRKLT